MATEEEVVVEEPHERADRTRGIVVFCPSQQQRTATLEVAQVHVIAQARANRATAPVDGEHDLRLRYVLERFDRSDQVELSGGERQLLGTADKELQVGALTGSPVAFELRIGEVDADYPRLFVLCCPLRLHVF